MQISAGLIRTAVSALSFWLGERLVLAGDRDILAVRSAFRTAASFAGTIFWLADCEYHEIAYETDSGEEDAIFRAARSMEERLRPTSGVIEFALTLNYDCSGMECIETMGAEEDLAAPLVHRSIIALSLYFGTRLLEAERSQEAAVILAELETEWKALGAFIRAAMKQQPVPALMLRLVVLKQAVARFRGICPRPDHSTIRQVIAADANMLDGLLKRFAHPAMKP